MMSRLLFQWHFAATGVRGTFATRRATLPVNSAHRHTTVSARIAIAVLRRRPLTAPGGCRPLFYVMFLTLKCLKSRTVARQTCPLWSDCRTLSNLDLPRASPWLRGPQNWILEAVPNYYNSLLARYIHFALLGSGGSRSSLGDPPGLEIGAESWTVLANFQVGILSRRPLCGVCEVRLCSMHRIGPPEVSQVQ